MEKRNHKCLKIPLRQYTLAILWNSNSFDTIQFKNIKCFLTYDYNKTDFCLVTKISLVANFISCFKSKLPIWEYVILFINQARTNTQPDKGQLWTRAWFPENVFRKVCAFVCMYVCVYVYQDQL